MLVAIKRNITPAKALLFAAGFTSSCFVGYWMFITMPEGFPRLLQWTVAIVSAIVFDGIITYLAFSQLQNRWNYITRLFAVIGGVLVTLALFYGLHWSWLHAIFIILGALFAHFISLEVEYKTPLSNAVELAGTEKERDRIIQNLLRTGMKQNDIAKVIGGNRAKTLSRIKELKG